MNFLKNNSKAIGAFVGAIIGALMINLLGLSDMIGATLIGTVTSLMAASMTWLFPANK